MLISQVSVMLTQLHMHVDIRRWSRMLKTFLHALVIPSGRSEKNNTFHCTILKSVKQGLECTNLDLSKKPVPRLIEFSNDESTRIALCALYSGLRARSLRTRFFV